MKAKLMSEIEGRREYVLVFDLEDEVMNELSRFAREESLGASHFTGIGAFSDVVLGYFEWQSKEYERIPVRAQVEVLSLAGDITLGNGQPTVHAHVVLGKRDGTAHGGHLLEAHVRPTLELVLAEMPHNLRRTRRPELGLSLIDVSS